jgi:hypothetical protein
VYDCGPFSVIQDGRAGVVLPCELFVAGLPTAQLPVQRAATGQREGLGLRQRDWQDSICRAR